jgi:hypothetical protein
MATGGWSAEGFWNTLGTAMGGRGMRCGLNIGRGAKPWGAKPGGCNPGGATKPGGGNSPGGAFGMEAGTTCGGSARECTGWGGSGTGGLAKGADSAVVGVTEGAVSGTEVCSTELLSLEGSSIIDN